MTSIEMERSRALWPWIFLLMMHMTDSYSEKLSVTETSSRREELNLLKTILSMLSDLEQLVKDQAIKMENIEEELNAINDKMSNCVVETSVYSFSPMTENTTNIATESTTKASTENATTVTTSTIPTSSIIQLPTSTGSRGQEFLILFMQNFPSSSGSVTVYITTHNNTAVNISTSPQLNPTIKSATDRVMNVSSYSKITFPFSLTCDYLTIETKAVLLQTSELSTVSILDSYNGVTNDGTLIIPTNKLSTKYLVSSTNPYRSNSDYYSQFAMAALSDRTSINISFRMKDNTSISLFGVTYRDMDVFTTTLDQYETLQIMNTADLSGTFIASTEPIAVFSGNRCQQFKIAWCSHMVTQLPPVTEYDNKYIVPTFYGNLGTMFQMTSGSQSSINVGLGKNVSKWHMNEKEFKNIELRSEVTFLESDNPILVTGFGMGSKKNDPYMTVIPGIHQYVNYYKVVVPEGYTNNYICVIIPQMFANHIQINGSSLEHYKIVRQGSALLETTFSIRTFEVSNGPIVLSTSNNSTFGLIVYGHREKDGYAFTGSYVLS